MADRWGASKNAKAGRGLKPALAAVLFVVGGKMLAAEWLKGILGRNFNLYLLGVIATILAVGVVASLIAERRRTTALAVGAGDVRRRTRSLTAAAIS